MLIWTFIVSWSWQTRYHFVLKINAIPRRILDGKNLIVINSGPVGRQIIRAQLSPVRQAGRSAHHKKLPANFLYSYRSGLNLFKAYLTIPWAEFPISVPVVVNVNVNFGGRWSKLAPPTKMAVDWGCTFTIRKFSVTFTFTTTLILKPRF